MNVVIIVRKMVRREYVNAQKIWNSNPTRRTARKSILVT
jgi:hypothetical protein